MQTWRSYRQVRETGFQQWSSNLDRSPHRRDSPEFAPKGCDKQAYFGAEAATISCLCPLQPKGRAPETSYPAWDGISLYQFIPSISDGLRCPSCGQNSGFTANSLEYIWQSRKPDPLRRFLHLSTRELLAVSSFIATDSYQFPQSIQNPSQLQVPPTAFGTFHMDFDASSTVTTSEVDLLVEEEASP